MNEVIKKKIKIFLLIKFEDIIVINGKVKLNYDKSQLGFCLGIVVDNCAINIDSKQIYPILNVNRDINLDTYYVLNIYDYGELIPLEDKYIDIKDDEQELMNKYEETINWYNDEVNIDDNVIYLQKYKALYK